MILKVKFYDFFIGLANMTDKLNLNKHLKSISNTGEQKTLSGYG